MQVHILLHVFAETAAMIVGFWVIKLHSLVSNDQHFGGICYLQFQGRRHAGRWFLPPRQHSVNSLDQKSLPHSKTQISYLRLCSETNTISLHFSLCFSTPMLPGIFYYKNSMLKFRYVSLRKSLLSGISNEWWLFTVKLNFMIF